MAASTIGPLVPADESFNHQITDTFATVAQADRSWTEKVCAMACARDGSLQLGFGMGKYPNRDVLDAYAGVSKGVQQWTVRASRIDSRLRISTEEVVTLSLPVMPRISLATRAALSWSRSATTT